MNNDVEIKKIDTLEELEEVQQLDQTIWTTEAIPVHQTLTAVQNGGIMIGAYKHNKLIGFSYGFPGFSEGKVYLCSHMLGIHPDFRGQGIGPLLKHAQKREALKMGYSLMTWTYDPLESVNAFLNLTKLSAVSNTYIENCYGEMADGLNDGLPTDRLKVRWHIANPYIGQTNEWNTEKLQTISTWKICEHGHPKLNDHALDVNTDETAFLLPVPENFQKIKREDFQLALDWRLKTRKLFQSAFQHNYVAVSIVKTQDEPVNYYVLTNKELALD
ncbi:GNAT family N-acetyltransferase [Bacillus aquiflavi]|uniref:GNAT family N-acetyltransferase n=1 Tax=Bacillus aquiflavi TaxID=2672567 RepID=A0A6B3VV63_9BACI|nr:GNAT family N-acetyltransferase [Bacillus aquiflavi]MBA4536505.1 GNAT family N-acetyltransferase [Bacillus aquiflavi]NEY80872.1 GNAT family N-acetyltransferase [Bacillus aquiflavi]UAC49596.1 GNAT family N-acetyltransferase [Bacillus aquiflavi]